MFRLYLQAIAALLIALVLYVGVLPGLISSSDSTAVLGGITIGLLYLGLVVKFFHKRIKKVVEKCARSDWR